MTVDDEVGLIAAVNLLRVEVSALRAIVGALTVGMPEALRGSAADLVRIACASSEPLLTAAAGSAELRRSAFLIAETYAGMLEK